MCQLRAEAYSTEGRQRIPHIFNVLAQFPLEILDSVYELLVSGRPCVHASASEAFGQIPAFPT